MWYLSQQPSVCSLVVLPGLLTRNISVPLSQSLWCPQFETALCTVGSPLSLHSLHYLYLPSLMLLVEARGSGSVLSLLPAMSPKAGRSDQSPSSGWSADLPLLLLIHLQLRASVFLSNHWLQAKKSLAVLLTTFTSSTCEY